MQMQADIIDRPVQRGVAAELSAIGAAAMAGIAAGLWPEAAVVARLRRAAARFEPRMPAGERDGLLAGWAAALQRTLLEPETFAAAAPPKPDAAAGRDP